MSHRRLEVQVTMYDDAGDAQAGACQSFDAAGTVGWGDSATIEAVAMIRYVVSTVRAGHEAFVDHREALAAFERGDVVELEELGDALRELDRELFDGLDRAEGC